MRVLIIDDHTLFRSGLSALLERRGIEVVAAAGSGLAGVEAAIEFPPEIILLDLRLPGMDGIAVLKLLRSKGVMVPVVMLTTSHDEEDLAAARQAGACGYLVKDIEPDDLVLALERILKGETVISGQLAGVMANIASGASEGSTKRPVSTPPSPLAVLTAREQEILTHLAEGLSNKAIARVLDISDGTVKLHVKAILRKLNLGSRVEAAVLAVKLGR